MLPPGSSCEWVPSHGTRRDWQPRGAVDTSPPGIDHRGDVDPSPPVGINCTADTVRRGNAAADTEAGIVCTTYLESTRRAEHTAYAGAAAWTLRALLRLTAREKDYMTRHGIGYQSAL